MAKLLAVRNGTLTPGEAALELEMAGLPIPHTIELLMSREKEPDSQPDDGSYSPVSPEEMAARAQKRREEIEGQRKNFVPQRQAEVQAIKEELGGGAFAPGGE